MGLDVRVFTKLKFVRSRQHKEDYPDEWDRGDWVLITNPPCYQRQVADLQPPGFWSGERSMSFRAGSYSGYNDWRNDLSTIALGVGAKEVWANMAKYEDAPFFDLINFSDCEGMIGPAACSRLATAFEAHQSKFPTQGYWKEKADEWLEACQIAAGHFGGLRFS